MYDLIIIGSGPAGLSAAVYGKRAGLNLLVIEKNPMSGGQVLNTYEVDNYLGLSEMNGFDMGVKFKEHAVKVGAQFLEAEVTGIEDQGSVKLVHTSEGDYETATVIFAMGATHTKLTVPGEEELTGMGVSYCATCDGAFFRGKEVAVVGGGDVAVEDAIFLARYCSKVHVIHRRDSLRAAKVLQDTLLSLENVEMHWNTTVEEILGTDMVSGVLLYKKEIGEKEILPVSGVFIAVGIKPEGLMVQDLVECDENGYVLAGEDGRTNVEGFYVAGDLRKKPMRQIITAVADGANAATSVSNDFMQKKR